MTYHCLMPSIVSGKTCLDVAATPGVVLCASCTATKAAAEVTRLTAALAASALEVERLRERVGMATEFNVHGFEMIAITGDDWTVRRRINGPDSFKESDEYLAPNGRWDCYALRQPPTFPTADAAFAALAATKGE